MLVTPHVLGYDLVLLAPAIAILAWDGFQRGGLSGERTSYVILWFWPWTSEAIANVTGIAFGVVGSLLVFALAMRRCRVLNPTPISRGARDSIRRSTGSQPSL